MGSDRLILQALATSFWWTPNSVIMLTLWSPWLLAMPFFEYFILPIINFIPSYLQFYSFINTKQELAQSLEAEVEWTVLL